MNHYPLTARLPEATVPTAVWGLEGERFHVGSTVEGDEVPVRAVPDGERLLLTIGCTLGLYL